MVDKIEPYSVAYPSRPKKSARSAWPPAQRIVVQPASSTPPIDPKLWPKPVKLAVAAPKVPQLFIPGTLLVRPSEEVTPRTARLPQHVEDIFADPVALVRAFERIEANFYDHIKRLQELPTDMQEKLTQDLENRYQEFVKTKKQVMDILGKKEAEFFCDGPKFNLMFKNADKKSVNLSELLAQGFDAQTMTQEELLKLENEHIERTILDLHPSLVPLQFPKDYFECVVAPEGKVRPVYVKEIRDGKPVYASLDGKLIEDGQGNYTYNGKKAEYVEGMNRHDEQLMSLEQFIDIYQQCKIVFGRPPKPPQDKILYLFNTDKGLQCQIKAGDNVKNLPLDIVSKEMLDSIAEKIDTDKKITLKERNALLFVARHDVPEWNILTLAQIAALNQYTAGNGLLMDFYYNMNFLSRGTPPLIVACAKIQDELKDIANINEYHQKFKAKLREIILADADQKYTQDKGCDKAEWMRQAEIKTDTFLNALFAHVSVDHKIDIVTLLVTQYLRTQMVVAGAANNVDIAPQGTSVLMRESGLYSTIHDAARTHLVYPSAAIMSAAQDDGRRVARDFAKGQNKQNFTIVCGDGVSLPQYSVYPKESEAVIAQQGFYPILLTGSSETKKDMIILLKEEPTPETMVADKLYLYRSIQDGIQSIRYKAKIDGKMHEGELQYADGQQELYARLYDKLMSQDVLTGHELELIFNDPKVYAFMPATYITLLLPAGDVKKLVDAGKSFVEALSEAGERRISALLATCRQYAKACALAKQKGSSMPPCPISGLGQDVVTALSGLLSEVRRSDDHGWDKVRVLLKQGAFRAPKLASGSVNPEIQQKGWLTRFWEWIKQKMGITSAVVAPAEIEAKYVAANDHKDDDIDSVDRRKVSSGVSSPSNTSRPRHTR